jgi:serine/threonine protein phosphatase PrpC
VAWWSEDGRLCLVADGGTRPGQHAELASATCARVARDLYQPEAGDDLIERVVRAVNSELLRRVASDEPVGTTTLALVHASASGRLLGAVMGDSTIVRIRPGEGVLSVRPLRKFDYYFSESEGRAAADVIFQGLPWWMQVSLTSQLPWASQGVVPTLTDLAPAPGDTLVVCSDGVADGVRLEDFAVFATRHEPSSLPMELIRHARSAGTTDDATSVVARCR